MAHQRRTLSGAGRAVCVAAAVGLFLSCGSPEPARSSSLLVITIDTLRADRIGRGLAPALDRLAADGVSFTNARANVPLTLPSHVTIMTGALPPEHGVRENGVHRFDRSRPTLARTLRHAGYRTGAFVGAFVLDRRFGLDDGFDEYDDRIRRDPDAPNRLEAERRAVDVADAAIRWLAQGDPARPFFVWAHFYDPHAPYDPPAAFLSAAKGHAYDGEVAYAGAEAARLMDAARQRAAGSLIVALAGDHGEGLGDHGEATHGMLAYDSTLRVPLVITGGPRAGKRRIDTPVTLRDLAPSLLALLGIPKPPEMTGADVLGGGSSDAYAETMYPRAAGWSPLSVLADEQWKVIQSSDLELYDLRRDPGETVNVSDRQPHLAAALGARARQMLSSGRMSVASAAPGAQERLRALGYVSASLSAAPASGREPNPRTGIDAWNRFERALSQLNSNDAGAALPGLRTLARDHPDARVFQSTYALALRTSGRAREALSIYRGLVSRWPGEAALFHDLAAAARDAAERQEALAAERAALALDPNDASAHNGLGLLYADAGRDADAANAFARAAELDPSNVSIWVNLGNARRAAGRLDTAADAYERGLRADPADPDAANGLGVVLVQGGRPADAIQWFERAILQDPALHEAQLNLGIALQESGMHCGLQRSRSGDIPSGSCR
jgi:arylsulfatase A-like enzyme/Flp pilus assembly protein TadD